MNFLKEKFQSSNELVKQVMMQDIQRRSYQRFLKTFKTDNMLFLVLHLNNYLSKEQNPFEIQKSLKRFFRRVDNKVFSSKSNKRLQRYVVIENLKKQKHQKRLHSSRVSNRTHVQIAIDVPRHLTKSKLRDIVRSSLDNQICNLSHVDVIDRYDELIDYNTKDMYSIKPTDTDITFDEVNSYRVKKRVHEHREVH